jgi:hypothetical protein
MISHPPRSTWQTVPLAVGCMPFLLETELVDVKEEGGLKIGDEKHGP